MYTATPYILVHAKTTAENMLLLYTFNDRGTTSAILGMGKVKFIITGKLHTYQTYKTFQGGTKHEISISSLPYKKFV